jgi:hypothetical protein
MDAKWTRCLGHGGGCHISTGAIGKGVMSGLHRLHEPVTTVVGAEYGETSRVSAERCPLNTTCDGRGVPPWERWPVRPINGSGDIEFVCCLYRWERAS